MCALKRIIVCADDFAQDPPTSDAILRLVDADRLSAVSCFTDASIWPRFGRRLAEHAGTTLLGLHFNLTRPFGHGERTLGEWIARALVGAIDTTKVRAHLERQLEAFTRIVGKRPDFIDGHQHVHAFPAVRSVVEDVAAALARDGYVGIRRVSPSFGRTDAPLKRWVIRRLAATRAAGVGGNGASHGMNSAFAGDYSLRAEADYAVLFSDWLDHAPDRGLIMCHPGPGSAAARREYDFLLSAGFRERLSSKGLRLLARADGLRPD